MEMPCCATECHVWLWDPVSSWVIHQTVIHELKKSNIPYCDVGRLLVQMEFNWKDSDDIANLGDWKRGPRGSKVWPH